jgi:lipid-binding SYLF domain-containing protein
VKFFWPLALSVASSCFVGVTGCAHPAPSASAPAPGAEAEQRIVDESAEAVTRVRTNARFSSMDGFLKEAHGVLVFPRLIRASFIVGGEGGTGVLVARGTDGSFSAPVFYGIGSGSIGPQIGYREAAVVLLLMNDNALSAVLRSGLTLGANASVAAGNNAGEARASTVTKDVIAFVDVDGVFAGASIDGAVVEPRPRLSRNYYGADVVPKEVVLDRKYDHPGANALRAALGAKSMAKAVESGAAGGPAPGVAAPAASAGTSPDASKLVPPNGDQRACSPESRQAEACTMISAPVCGVVDTGVRCVAAPCPEASKLVQFSNACNACKDSKTLAYYVGACVSVPAAR